jgi:hypothetical protein
MLDNSGFSGNSRSSICRDQQLKSALKNNSFKSMEQQRHVASTVQVSDTPGTSQKLKCEDGNNGSEKVQLSATYHADIRTCHPVSTHQGASTTKTPDRIAESICVGEMRHDGVSIYRGKLNSIQNESKSSSGGKNLTPDIKAGNSCPVICPLDSTLPMLLPSPLELDSDPIAGIVASPLPA